MKTPREIASEVVARNYDTDEWPNNVYGESGLTLALAMGEVDADGIEAMIVAAIEADRRQREQSGTSGLFLVGDPDPTPGSPPFCNASSSYSCSRRPGHRGPHVAGDGLSIIEVWS